MSNEKMSADEALKVLRSLVTPKANRSGGRPPISAPGAEENRARAIEFFAALIAERDALREDAERWRHARKLLTIDDIEGAQGAYESFGRLVSEEECIRADSAIDAARTNEST